MTYSINTSVDISIYYLIRELYRCISSNSIAAHQAYNALSEISDAIIPVCNLVESEICKTT